MTLSSTVDFKSVFETLPGLYLILTPELNIAAVSDAYLHATLTKREAILGKHLFEVFPDNPDDNTADGVFNLRASLNEVLTKKEAHKMRVQKYDIRRPNGEFEERYWSPVNSPVFNTKNEIEYIIHNVVDVTASQLQKEKLKKTEASYHLLVDSVEDYAIFMLDEEGLVTSWNSGAERISGYTADEIIGKPIDLFYTPEQIEQDVPGSYLRRALQDGKMEDEGWRVKKDGTFFLTNCIITSLRNDNGDHYGYSVVTRDITEQKKALQQVETLSFQINQCNDAIYTVDDKFKIQSWNRGAEKLYGFTAAEAIGMESLVLLRTDVTRERLNELLKLIAEKGYFTGEIKRTTKDGRDIYVLSSVTTIRDKGVITGYTAVSFDITEQKRLRKEVDHLADIVDQSSEAIISRCVANQKILSWNKGAEVLFGYTKEEAVGKVAMELGFLKMTKSELEFINSEINKNGYWKSEREFYHRDGRVFFGAVSANTVLNERGEVVSMVFIVKDISLKRQLEQQLKRYNEELEEKVKLRTDEIRKTESRFRSLIENNNDIIVLTDASLRVIYRSPSAARITGWADEEIKQNNFTQKIHADDRKKIAALYEDCLKKPGSHLYIAYRTFNKYGICLHMEGIMSNLLHEEHVKAIVLNLRDVTERNKTDEALKNSFAEKQALAQRMSIILNTLPAYIALLNSKGGIMEVNDAWRNFNEETGLIGAVYNVGNNYINIIKAAKGIIKADALKVANGITQVLKNKKQEFIYEYTCCRFEQQKWFRMVVTPLHEKEYAGAVIMHLDVSELRRLEQERLKSKIEEQKKIAKAIIIGQEKERNYLGQELHDNINQILTSTKMYLGVAAKKNKEVRALVKYPIELVDTSIEEIRRLCYKMTTPQKNVQLKQLVQELLDNMNEAVNIKTAFLCSMKNNVLPDDLQINIYRIIQELTNNILKYAEARKVKISITANKKAVDIIVSDNGKGFDLERKRKGIGISNIINRVKSFNGDIEINTSAGKGCITAISIPY